MKRNRLLLLYAFLLLLLMQPHCAVATEESDEPSVTSRQPYSSARSSFATVPTSISSVLLSMVTILILHCSRLHYGVYLCIFLLLSWERTRPYDPEHLSLFNGTLSLMILVDPIACLGRVSSFLFGVLLWLLNIGSTTSGFVIQILACFYLLISKDGHPLNPIVFVWRSVRTLFLQPLSVLPKDFTSFLWILDRYSRTICLLRLGYYYVVPAGTWLGTNLIRA